VMVVGQVMVGTSVSLIVTSKVQEAEFPETVKVLNVVPTGKAAPLARPAVCVVVAPVQLSVPVGSVKVTTLVHWPGSLVPVMLAGQVIVGASVSEMVTVKLQEAEFPELSVTVKVLNVAPTGKAAPLARPPVCVVVALGQLSVPIGAVKVTWAVQRPGSLLVVMLPGQVMVGSSVSVMVTSKVQEAEFPELSETVTVLNVVPTGKAAPLARPAVWVVVALGQLSTPVGAVKVTTFEQRPGSLVPVMLPGQVIVGASVSVTVTVKLQEAEFPELSETVKVLNVVPTGKAAPLARPAVWVVVALGQLSVPEGAV
jgi:hypothetical protein